MFAEIIFENGTRSVGEYENEEEVLAAAGSQHARAGGSAGGPTGHMAERVVSIHIYNQHPNEWGEPSQEVLQEELKNMDTEGGAMEIAARVRELTSPLVTDPEPGESMYKMEPIKILDEGWEEE